VIEFFIDVLNQSFITNENITIVGRLVSS